jgi:hypothetical protein
MHSSMPVTGDTDLRYAPCPIYHKIDFFFERLILIYKLRIVFTTLINSGGISLLEESQYTFTVSVTFLLKTVRKRRTPDIGCYL